MIRFIVVLLVSTTAYCATEPSVVSGSFPQINARRQQNETRVFLVCAIDSRNNNIIEHFVTYYNKTLGVPLQHFLIILNARDHFDEQLAVTRTKLITLGIRPVVWIGLFSAQAALHVKFRLLANITALDWLLMLDIDEFVRIDRRIDIVVERYKRIGYTHSHGYFVDRVSRDGSLPDINASVPIGLQFPLRCNLTKALLGGMIDKCWLVRGDFRAGPGNHKLLLTQRDYSGVGLPAPKQGMPRNYAAPDNWPIDHYKWSSVVIGSLRERYQHYLKSGRTFWRESKRFIDSYSTLGKIDTRTYCKE